MSELSENAALKKCLQQIELRLNRGPAGQWTNYDFEKLSADIEEKTGVLLSISTLKRIWGKVKSSHTPTLTTLNALARFLDAADWRDFENNLNRQVDTPEIKPAVPVPARVSPFSKKRKFSLPNSLFMMLLLFIALGFLIFSGKKQEDHSIDPSAFSFSADKMISVGVPNSVVFHYDASAAKSDSVYIVQTWDIRRKTLVSKNNHAHSAIYYYPGFFRTKLIIDSVIVKKHDLQIATDGWLALVETDGIPLYFKKDEFEKSDRLEVDSALLGKYNLTLYPQSPRLRFFNQGDLGDLMNSDFTFETTLKNQFNTGTNACQFVQVLIQCKDDIIIIPLAAKTCSGDLTLYACGKAMHSKDADLSGFGTDLNAWTTLRVETKNKDIKFLVNGTEAASFTFPNDPTGIVGVQYRFNGVGAIKEAWFENKSGKRILK